MQKIKISDVLIAFGLSVFAFVFLFMVSTVIDPNASMDAAYYHVMADQLEQGRGFVEPIVWQHLNKYHELMHPMDYWMPLGIVGYYLSRTLFGPSREVFLNIFLWTVLVTTLFFDIRSRVSNQYYALFGYLILLFCGRNLFYLLTTDNMAIYAFLGYFYVRFLCSEKIKPFRCGIFAGLLALTRIEGIIFAFLGGCWILLKNRSLRCAFKYALVFFLVLSPWMWRNYHAVGKIWTSNSSAIFIQEYEEIFSHEFKGDLAHLLELGTATLLKQRLLGLWNSFLNLVAVPGMFLLYPFWILGIGSEWKREGAIFSAFLTAFWLLCGVLFTHQAIKGTSMHISAFFYPHYAMFAAVGFFRLTENRKFKRSFNVFLAFTVIVWAIAFSMLSVKKLNEGYLNDNRPYQKLFASYRFPENARIVSVYPVYIYFLAGIPGAVYSPLDKGGALAVADKYNCNFILLDSRTRQGILPCEPDWAVVASDTYLTLFKRIRATEK
ncbi:MAG: hypothetical protein Kow0029_16390 [Candidatus Rifleibacteriota bacterium]